MPEITEYKISDLTTAAQVDESDFVELSQADENVSGGRISLKATILAIANKIANGINFTSALQTTDKTIVGAINEVAQGGGGGSDVEVTPILTEGTKIATITVNDVDADIYGENTKEELGKLSAEKTATGNPVTLETVNGGMAKSCEVTMNPIQDLHGYDYPWAGGNGKNKYTSKYGGRTNNGIIYSISNGNIILNGKATDTSYYASSTSMKDLTFYISLPAGTYTLNKTNLDYISFRLYNYNGFDISLIGSSTKTEKLTFTLESDSSVFVNVKVEEHNETYTDKELFIQIESGSSETDYAPYSNICPISGWDGLNLTRTGKNLFDKTAITDGSWLSTTTGEVETSSSTTNYVVSDYIPVMANKTVYIPASNTVRRWFYDISHNAITYLNNSGNQAYTPTQDGYIRVSINKTQIDINGYQVEYGSTATAYEPYNGQTKTITFPSTIYGGTDEVVDGEGQITESLLTINDLNLTKHASGCFYAPIDSKARTNVGLKCSCFHPLNGDDYSSSSIMNAPNGSIGQNRENKSVYIRADEYETVADLKTALGSQTLSFVLETPTPFSTTPTPIPLNNGTNVVSSDADDIELKYSEMMTIDDVKSLISEAIGTVLNTEF